MDFVLGHFVAFKKSTLKSKEEYAVTSITLIFKCGLFLSMSYTSYSDDVNVFICKNAQLFICILFQNKSMRNVFFL